MTQKLGYPKLDLVSYFVWGLGVVGKKLTSAVGGDVVFVLLLKINYDLIVIKPTSLISHLNRRAADARENAPAESQPTRPV